MKKNKILLSPQMVSDPKNSDAKVISSRATRTTHIERTQAFPSGERWQIVRSSRSVAESVDELAGV